MQKVENYPWHQIKMFEIFSSSLKTTAKEVDGIVLSVDSYLSSDVYCSDVDSL